MTSPSLSPLPALPPPHMPRGAQYNTEIYVVMIVAGSIDEFNNIIVRNNYIQAMATLFNCVADDVTIVNVAAASVQVGTLIVSGDMSASNLAIQLLNSGNVSQIRAALGNSVPVIGATVVNATSRQFTAPPPPPPSPPPDSPSYYVVLLILCCLLACVLACVCAAVLACCWRDHRKRRAIVMHAEIYSKGKGTDDGKPLSASPCAWRASSWSARQTIASTAPTARTDAPPSPQRQRPLFIRLSSHRIPVLCPHRRSLRRSSMRASESSYDSGGAGDGSPLGLLSVKLHSASGLKAKDLNGKSDPYVIFQFMDVEVRSSVKEKTVTPLWEESIIISKHMSAALMLGGKLSVTIMDKDAGIMRDMYDSKDDKIGECVVALNVLDGKKSHEFKQALSPKGTIHFTAKFSPRVLGHEWIGQEIIRSIDGVEIHARVTAWAPAVGSDPASWHVVHNDGDEKELNEADMLAALKRASNRNEEAENREEVEEAAAAGAFQTRRCRARSSSYVHARSAGETLRPIAPWELRWALLARALLATQTHKLRRARWLKVRDALRATRLAADVNVMLDAVSPPPPPPPPPLPPPPPQQQPSSSTACYTEEQRVAAWKEYTEEQRVAAWTEFYRQQALQQQAQQQPAQHQRPHALPHASSPATDKSLPFYCAGIVAATSDEPTTVPMPCHRPCTKAASSSVEPLSVEPRPYHPTDVSVEGIALPCTMPAVWGVYLRTAPQLDDKQHFSTHARRIHTASFLATISGPSGPSGARGVPSKRSSFFPTRRAPQIPSGAERPPIPVTSAAPASCRPAHGFVSHADWAPETPFICHAPPPQPPRPRRGLDG